MINKILFDLKKSAFDVFFMLDDKFHLKSNRIRKSFLFNFLITNFYLPHYGFVQLEYLKVKKKKTVWNI